MTKKVKEPKGRPLGYLQCALVAKLREPGAYVRRQLDDELVSWLRSGAPLELGDRPESLENRVVDSLIRRGMLAPVAGAALAASVQQEDLLGEASAPVQETARAGIFTLTPKGLAVVLPESEPADA